MQKELTLQGQETEKYRKGQTSFNGIQGQGSPNVSYKQKTSLLNNQTIDSDQETIKQMRKQQFEQLQNFGLSRQQQENQQLYQKFQYPTNVSTEQLERELQYRNQLNAQRPGSNQNEAKMHQTLQNDSKSPVQMRSSQRYPETRAGDRPTINATQLKLNAQRTFSYNNQQKVAQVYLKSSLPHSTKAKYAQSLNQQLQNRISLKQPWNNVTKISERYGKNDKNSASPSPKTHSNFMSRNLPINRQFMEAASLPGGKLTQQNVLMHSSLDNRGFRAKNKTQLFLGESLERQVNISVNHSILPNKLDRNANNRTTVEQEEVNNHEPNDVRKIHTEQLKDIKIGLPVTSPYAQNLKLMPSSTRVGRPPLNKLQPIMSPTSSLDQTQLDSFKLSKLILGKTCLKNKIKRNAVSRVPTTEPQQQRNQENSMKFNAPKHSNLTLDTNVSYNQPMLAMNTQKQSSINRPRFAETAGFNKFLEGKASNIRVQPPTSTNLKYLQNDKPHGVASFSNALKARAMKKRAKESVISEEIKNNRNQMFRHSNNTSPNMQLFKQSENQYSTVENAAQRKSGTIEVGSQELIEIDPKIQTLSPITPNLSPRVGVRSQNISTSEQSSGYRNVLETTLLEGQLKVNSRLENIQAYLEKFHQKVNDIQKELEVLESSEDTSRSVHVQSYVSEASYDIDIVQDF